MLVCKTLKPLLGHPERFSNVHDARSIAFHPLQMIFSALAWRSLAPTHPAPRLIIVVALRWIREAVNNLLPMAQIGGEFVGAWLLRQGGAPLTAAGASVRVDLTMEMMSQIGFTLLGLALLVPSLHEPRILPWTIGATSLAGGVVILFIAAQRFGSFHLIERGLVGLAARGAGTVPSSRFMPLRQGWVGPLATICFRGCSAGWRSCWPFILSAWPSIFARAS
jgi:hypothetical protein